MAGPSRLAAASAQVRAPLIAVPLDDGATCADARVNWTKGRCAGAVRAAERAAAGGIEREQVDGRANAQQAGGLVSEPADVRVDESGDVGRYEGERAGESENARAYVAGFGRAAFADAFPEGRDALRLPRRWELPGMPLVLVR